MWGRFAFVVVMVVVLGRVPCGAAERWYNFAEDMDMKYYLDQKSVVSRPGSVYIFWVKSVAKDRDFFKREYNLNDLAYLLTSFELDCSDATYRIRQVVMYDKNRRELNKTAPSAPDAGFEPIPPESSIELAQETVCKNASNETEEAEEAEEGKAPAAAQPPVPPDSVQREEVAPVPAPEGAAPAVPEPDDSEPGVSLQ